MAKDGGTLTEVSEICPLYGTPYERLIGRNGALTGEQKQREQEKYEKAERERGQESPEKREARIHKYDTDRSFFKEIPEAYNFKIIGEPTISGRPTWQIEMTPRPEYVPKNTRAAMLRHIQGTLWIDKQDLRWAKAHAEVTDTISLGWIVARVGPGAKFTLEQTRLSSDLWLPKKIDVDAMAKVMLVHEKNLTEHLTYSNFREASEGEKTITRNKMRQPAGSQSFKE